MISDKLRDKGKFWTDGWTIVRGCTPVSEGCVNCWAAAMAYRFKQSVGGVRLTTASGPWTGEVYPDYDALKKPGGEKNPKIYAVWNDLFHPDVPDKFIILAWHVMAQNLRHTFIIITKRPERAARWAREHCIKPLGNVWFMGSTETQGRLEERAAHIVRFPAVVRGVIIEPMLGSVGLMRSETGKGFHDTDWDGKITYLERLNWVIIGVETGHPRRSCDIENIRQVVQQCKAANVPVWVKGVEVDGKIVHKLDDLPADLRVREMPR